MQCAFDVIDAINDRRASADDGAPRVPAAMFRPVETCWVCGGRALDRYHEVSFDFSPYIEQDPGLHAYTGCTGWLARCATCGFAQPDALPTLPRYFDRMYDQQWSQEWIEHEFEAEYKDFIFQRILATLRRLRGTTGGRLLDIGAHAGRFMHAAQLAGWTVEGIELNARTAECASRRTRAVVHRINAHDLADRGVRYDALTLTDVLEHIPEPVPLLTSVGRLVGPNGVIAVKVPCGRSQWHKERALAMVRRSRRVSLADNLVHVNHFTPTSLRRALQAAGFRQVSVRTAPPELLSSGNSPLSRTAANAIRLAVYAAGRLPGAVFTPLALHLQAFARK